jgi:Tfp pilus assembly protein PilF
MISLARLLILACLPLLMAGCATTRPQAPLAPAELLSDSAFRPATDAVSASKLFELSPAMRTYLRSSEFMTLVRRMGPERGLIEALYKKGELKLEYDSSITRNAAETFDARMGNCLSLVVMTAAFAKELGLFVQFQDVVIDDVWTRNNGIYFASTHVNLSLSKRKLEPMRGFQPDERMLTIDFMPPEQSATLRTRPLDEREIVAMYLNNRAAEALSEKRLDDAYWWARASVLHLPTFGTAYNTLGVIYQRHGDLTHAERAFKGALKLEPDSTVSMHNLVPVLTSLGKQAEAAALAAHLISLEPTPPFFYFNKGTVAMEQGQYAEARRLFAKEVRRAPFNHEFHFWLALAHWRLGEPAAAREELTRALENSTTKDASERYSQKLAALRAMASGQRARAY